MTRRQETVSVLQHDLARIRSDGRLAGKRRWGAFVLAGYFVRYRSARFVMLVRTMHRLHNRKRLVNSLAVRGIKTLLFYLFGSEVNPNSVIGPGLYVPHPHGIIIGGDTHIGSDLHLGQMVTIGGNFGKTDNGSAFPVIGNSVSLLAGSVIAGPITIGDNAVVGANAVVTDAVPGGSVVKASGSPDGSRLAALSRAVESLGERIGAIEEELQRIRRHLPKP